MRPLRGYGLRVVVALCCLLAVATSAHAEGAWVLWVLLLFAALALVGCTHNTTLRRAPDGGQVIYRLSEARAFTLVLAAYAEVLPQQSLFDLAGPRRGYRSTWRFIDAVE